LWATRGPQFRKAFPDVHVDVCGASIMFYAPLLRDICMWSGGREVSGSALRIALKQQRSVLLVPGGQREMRHSVANPLELTLVTRHRGFIRLAIEHGTPLVPVLSIGETMLLENVRAPRMQAYTLRTFGVGFPIWPYGRWYSPLPNRTKILVVFGQPIEVPKQDKPSAQLVEDVHAAYYKQLQHMFEQHKNLVPGFEECKLVYTDD
jgi:2-acylglycerol O-acyltransferase 2